MLLQQWQQKLLFCPSGTMTDHLPNIWQIWKYVFLYIEVLSQLPRHDRRGHLATHQAQTLHQQCCKPLRFFQTTRAHASHMVLTTCDLLHSPNARKCHPFTPRHLMTIPFKMLWIARLLLSLSQRQIAFVPSVMLMYEKFKMSQA